MKYMVAYITDKGQIGNVDCDFLNDPPSMLNIRNAEKEISTKYCNHHKTTIINWLKISD